MEFWDEFGWFNPENRGGVRSLFNKEGDAVKFVVVPLSLSKIDGKIWWFCDGFSEDLSNLEFWHGFCLLNPGFLHKLLWVLVEKSDAVKFVVVQLSLSKDNDEFWWFCDGFSEDLSKLKFWHGFPLLNPDFYIKLVL